MCCAYACLWVCEGHEGVQVAGIGKEGGREAGHMWEVWTWFVGNGRRVRGFFSVFHAERGGAI